MNYRLLWSTLLLCLYLPWRLGAVPTTINYQGRISLTYGAQVADGPYTPVFNIYHQATGGSWDWEESDTVNTKNGLFSVVLGQSSPLSILPGDQQYWLEVVWAGQTMSPRQPLTSAPYALWAGSVDLPLAGTAANLGGTISVTNTAGPGVAGFGLIGVVGKGSQIGVQGQAANAGATGVLADYGGFGSSYALKVSGPAQFWGGPVSFTGNVDFSQAVVSGLSGGGVTVPLTLTGALAGPVLSASNTGAGNAAFFYGPNGAGVVAQGFTGVAATGSSIGLSASAGLGTGVYTQGQIGINASGVQSGGRFYSGQSGGNGVYAVAAVPNTTGLVADFGGGANSYAMKVSGPAQFWGGPVSFTSSVDFSGATVTGLAVTIPVPLTLTGNLTGPVLSATNTGAGNAANFLATGSGAALLAQGGSIGISATSTTGPSLFADNISGGGFQATILAYADNTNHAVEARNSTYGSLGILGGTMTQGFVGVYGLSTNGNQGVWGESGQGPGVYGDGLIGVEGKVTGTGETALLGDYGGFAGSYALKVSGPAEFWGGPVSFTGSVDFTGATVTGLTLTGGVAVPLSLSGSVAFPGAVLSATNTGSGWAGIFNGQDGVLVQSQATGLSVTALLSPAISAGSTNVGILSQAPTAISATGSGFGGHFSTNAAGGVGVATDAGGVANAYALRVSGPAQFWGGPVSFTGAVDFSGATVTGLGSAQSVTANVAWPGGVFNANNIGTGYGVFGRSSAPGASDAQGNPLTINAGVYGYANVSLAAGVYGYSAYPTSGAAGVVAIGPTGIYGVGNGANGEGGSFQANSGTAVNAQGLNGIQSHSGPGGKALELTVSSPTDTALMIDNGTSSINGSVLVATSVSAGSAALRVQQSQVNFGGNAIYGSIQASATAAVMGESFDLTPPNSSGTASSGVYGHGASGVIGQSTIPGGFGVIGAIDATGNTSSVGVFAVNNGQGIGLSAQGLTGTVARTDQPGGLGLLASDGGQGIGAQAFMASGASVFNGPVQFNGAVSGLSMGVSAPLSLTANLSGPIISGANTGNGPGVSGTALVANEAGVVGENDVFNGLGLLGLSANGLGIAGLGSTVGVSATATGPSGLALYARDNSSIGTLSAYNDNSSVSNSAVFGETKGGYGVYGYSLGANGVGVLGQGNDIGVQATLNGNSGDGFNDNVNTSGNAAYLVNNGGNGVYGAGTTHGVQAGVIGNAGDAIYSNVSISGNVMDLTNNGTGGAILATTNGGSEAIYGTNSNLAGGTVGVRGDSNASTGLTYGVYGSNASTGGYGVYGTNATAGAVATGGQAGASGVGVYGTTQFGYPTVGGVGVLGNSPGLAGVYGTSASAIGVIAAGASAGLSATATSGPAVIARANTAGTAVQGINDNTAATASGVLGAGSTNGIGVKGQVVGGAAGSIGVYGVNDVAGAYGVQADNTNATSTSGAALFVNGLLKVSTSSYNDASTTSSYTGATLSSPSGRVTFSNGKSVVTSIGPFTATMVSPNSVVLVTFATSAAVNGYGVTVATGGGSFTIHFQSSVTLSTNDVMNFVIINQ